MSRIVAPNNPGKCRVCGCTESRPCQRQFEDGPVPCSWLNAEKTLCSSLACVAEVPLDELISMLDEAA